MIIKIDIFAILILLGIFQGIFLSYFFLEKRNRKIVSNKIMGFFLITLSLILIEIFLGYTGYIEKVLFLVDFSEPLNFAIGPLFFLIFYAKIYAQLKKGQYLHFVPLMIYFLYSGFFFFQSYEHKYNAYISSFRPDQSLVEATYHFSPDPLGIKHIVNELTILHLIIYSVLTLVILIRTSKKEGIPLYKRMSRHLNWLRISVALFIAIIFIILYVKLSFSGDLGDYIFASLISLIIYINSFRMIKDSVFFKQADGESGILYKKYGKSALTDELKENILKKILIVMENEKPYLNNLFSLPALAKQISATPNHVSQVINECMNKNFYDFISTYRIKEAQAILSDPEKDNLTIIEIAEMVGYNSKSAFNIAFKKITSMTPSQFKKSR